MNQPQLLLSILLPLVVVKCQFNCGHASSNHPSLYFRIKHNGIRHLLYSTYEDMLRDAECWDCSIKEKHNQQSSLVKEEDEAQQPVVKVRVKPIIKDEYKPIMNKESSSGRSESKPRSFVIQLNNLDVYVRVVDCLEKSIIDDN